MKLFVFLNKKEKDLSEELDDNSYEGPSYTEKVYFDKFLSSPIVRHPMNKNAEDSFQRMAQVDEFFRHIK